MNNYEATLWNISEEANRRFKILNDRFEKLSAELHSLYEVKESARLEAYNKSRIFQDYMNGYGNNYNYYGNEYGNNYNGVQEYQNQGYDGYGYQPQYYQQQQYQQWAQNGEPVPQMMAYQQVVQQPVEQFVDPAPQIEARPLQHDNGAAQVVAEPAPKKRCLADRDGQGWSRRNGVTVCTYCYQEQMDGQAARKHVHKYHGDQLKRRFSVKQEPVEAV